VAESVTKYPRIFLYYIKELFTMNPRILTVLAALGIFAAIGTVLTATTPTAAFAFDCDRHGENGRPAGCDGNPHSGPTKDGGNPHHPPNDGGNPHFNPGK
jgi:hypothetical protein